MAGRELSRNNRRSTELAAGDDRVTITPLDPVLRVVARTPVYADLDDTLRSIAAIMAEEAIGAVLVRGPHGPAGIVSERDVTLAVASGADPERQRARDVMTPDVATVAGDDPIRAAAERMLANEIRHLAVVKGSATIGLVSMRDVLAVFADQSATEAATQA